MPQSREELLEQTLRELLEAVEDHQLIADGLHLDCCGYFKWHMEDARRVLEGEVDAAVY